MGIFAGDWRRELGIAQANGKYEEATFAEQAEEQLIRISFFDQVAPHRLLVIFYSSQNTIEEKKFWENLSRKKIHKKLY